MKKLTVLPLLAAGALTLSFASCGTKQTPSLKTDIDSVSYAIGVNTGLSYKQNLESFPGGQANVDDMIAGFANALKGDTTMSQEQAISIIQTYFMQAEQKEAAKTKEEGEKFLAENKTKDGVITTESGLQYKIDSVGTGPIPTADDQVTVHYTGRLLDGTVFDSSVERGQPATFGVTQVIKGWTEALQMMPVGSKWTLYIPAELAYGDRAAGPKIKPNSTLVFDVQLLGIEPKADAKKK